MSAPFTSTHYTPCTSRFSWKCSSQTDNVSFQCTCLIYMSHSRVNYLYILVNGQSEAWIISRGSFRKTISFMSNISSLESAHKDRQILPKTIIIIRKIIEFFVNFFESNDLSKNYLFCKKITFFPKSMVIWEMEKCNWTKRPPLTQKLRFPFDLLKNGFNVRVVKVSSTPLDNKQSYAF